MYVGLKELKNITILLKKYRFSILPTITVLSITIALIV